MYRVKDIGLRHVCRVFLLHQQKNELLRSTASLICLPCRHKSNALKRENRRLKKEVMRPKIAEPASAMIDLFLDANEKQKLTELDSNKADGELEEEDGMKITSKLKVTYGSVKNKLELGVYLNDKPYDPETGAIVTEEETGVAFTSHTHGRFGEEIAVQGTPDPRVPVTKFPCHGCGALMHCQDPNMPGYMVSERLHLLAERQLVKAMCQRCILLKKYNLALSVALTPKNYADAIGKLKRKKGLVVIVLDVSDLPNSIYRDLPSLIGEGRDVYIVGNKVDVLPKDASGYLVRTMDCLQHYIDVYGFSRKFNVRHMSLVSAKTGYGIEDLISVLLRDWAKNGNVYVVGCTNVGKSTLFNKLIMSDFCKPASRNLMNPATTSVWPGTTLNLLKFPVYHPKPIQLHEREKRLAQERLWQVEEEKLRRSKIKTPADYKYAIVRGHVGTTFDTPKDRYLERLQKEENQQLPSFSKFAPEIDPEWNEERIIDDEALGKKMEVKDKIYRIQAAYDKEARQNAHWCFDTPGVINPEQIINLLTPEELSIMLTKRLIHPKTFALRPNKSLFISGLGRIDYLKGDKKAIFTVFCSVHLPVIIQDTITATLFHRNKLGTDRLLVPQGDQKRLDRLPALVGKEFTIKGRGTHASARDITLSSLGWVAITPDLDEEITVRAYTPGGYGIQSRPSLLRFAVSRRGYLGKGGIYRGNKPLP